MCSEYSHVFLIRKHLQSNIDRHKLFHLQKIDGYLQKIDVLQKFYGKKWYQIILLTQQFISTTNTLISTYIFLIRCHDYDCQGDVAEISSKTVSLPDFQILCFNRVTWIKDNELLVSKKIKKPVDLEE